MIFTEKCRSRRQRRGLLVHDDGYPPATRILDAITVIALALGVTGIVRGLRMRASKLIFA